MKNAAVLRSSARRRPVRSSRPGDRRTRDRVTQLLLRAGRRDRGRARPALGLSPAAIRRHLDAMLADGPGRRPRAAGARAARAGPAGEGVHAHRRRAARRSRTRTTAWPPRRCAGSPSTGGPAAVAAFAAAQVSGLEERCRAAMAEAGDDPLARAEALAEALTAEGYAASASTIASGGQLCQHHCPVAHVAAEFPQLCEAETQVISRLVGTHVQRLATIANGDGVCTTHIPAPTHCTRHTVRTDR